MKRLATVLAPEDLGTTGTKIIDIGIQDVISRLEMRWRCTNVTVSVMLDAVLACITKVELVDGSEVIASLSGLELQALNFYDRKIMPYNNISLTVGGYFESAFGIDFGRYLFDPLYALDPRRYKNLQLRISWDEDACNTSVVVNEFAVFAWIDDDPAAQPVGYLKPWEVKSIAMGTSTHDYTDLPTDHPIRRLLIRAYSTDHDPVLCLSNLKIDCDNGRFIPLDVPANSLAKILREYPEICESYTLDAAVTAKTLYANLSEHLYIAIDYDATAFVTAQSKFALPTITGAKIALAVSVDIKALTAQISGRSPHNAIPLDFGNPNEPDTWLDVTRFGAVKLDTTFSSDADSGDTLMVVAQQAKKY